MRWWKRRSARDFAEEIESHLEFEREQQVAEGRSRDEARFGARRAFGNLTAARERFFDSRRGAGLDSAWRNLRYAARGLLRRRGFAATAIVTLAFGIGVNSALITVLYSLLLRPLPVRGATHVVSVTRAINGRYSLKVFGRESMLSYPDYQRLQRESQTLAQLAVYRGESMTLLSGDRAIGVRAQLASCNYFATLQVAMRYGRPFAPDECAAAGDGGVVVLSFGAWQRQFGSDSTIVGRTVVVNRLPFTVVGVAEPGFAGIDMDRTELWIPVTMFPRLHPEQAGDLDADVSWLSAVGRLVEHASIASARVELSALARREDANWPGRETSISVARATLFPAQEDRKAAAPIAMSVLALGLLVLVMACANVMNLLLARAAARRREIGIRLSLGASRPRLVMQLLTESVLLAALGGLLGMALAYWIPPLLLLAAPVQEVNIRLAPDGWVMLTTAGVALGAALLFGLVPALQSTDLSLTAAMRNDSTSTRHVSPASRMRSIAVGVQVAASALLLVTAALFLRATRQAFAVDPGYATRGTVSLLFNLEQLGYDGSRSGRFMDALRRALAATPGVKSVAVTQFAALRGRGNTVVNTNPAVQDSTSERETLFNHVSTSYFETAGIAIVRGRGFSEREESQRDPTPVVVSEAFARTAWGAGEPIGRELADGTRRMTVVGIARDVQSVSLGIDDGPYLYSPAHPSELLGRLLIVRSDLPATSVRALAEREALRLDPGVLVTSRSIEEGMAAAIAPVRIAGLFATGLGGVALLLAVVGVYGVVSFGVSQRSREIGIRIALGATPRSVQRLVLREGGRVIGIGLLGGLLAAAGAAQVIRSLLFGLNPLDATAFSGAALALGIASALAVSIPAARAARVDPVTTLREE
ncbi:MAG: ADOP family duplicated permease [Gemmatimonadota bacterium]